MKRGENCGEIISRWFVPMHITISFDVRAQYSGESFWPFALSVAYYVAARKFHV